MASGRYYLVFNEMYYRKRWAGMSCLGTHHYFAMPMQKTPRKIRHEAMSLIKPYRSFRKILPRMTPKTMLTCLIEII
jgi:hypothetical protein